MIDEGVAAEGAKTPLAEKSKALRQLLQERAKHLDSYVQVKLPADLRSVVDPSDVLQDVFFEAFRRLDDFEPRVPDAAFRWLLTIARHRVLALIRHHRGSASDSSGSKRPTRIVDVESMLEELAVYVRTPSQSAMSHEIAAVVQRSLEALKPDFRRIIQLRYFDGLSTEQSAAQMGRTQGAITMLYRRGLKSLRSRLLEAGAVAL